MDLPRLEPRAFSALSRLGSGPVRIGELDHGALLRLTELGLVIRYQTIFLITPLGVILLQRQPLRRLASLCLALGRRLAGRGAAARRLAGDQPGPALVWRA